MRVGVTGATGFVGRAVVAALVRRGDSVVALTRSPATAKMPTGVDVVAFDVNAPSPDPKVLRGLEAIVHLAGETVDGRWTTAKKRAIFDSRVAGTRKLVASIAQLGQKPRALIAASAVGYYGNRGDELLDEDSPPGHDFLAGVCTAWEREASAATKLGVRVVSVRSATVLGPGGGALARLAPIFRAGIGGPLGNGRQWMPWIHVDDVADLYCFLLDREDLRGPIAAVTPDYATNARLMHAVGSALARPALLPAPTIALKLVLGEFADSLLGGQLIVPQRAMDAGYTWRHPHLEQATIDALAPGSGRKPASQSFVSEQFVLAPREKVFAFFNDAAALAKVSPPAMRMRMLTPTPVPLRRGTTVDYKLTVRGIRLRWRATIVECKKEEGFTDIQIRGPYLYWRHAHEFESKDGGVVVRDRICYGLPLAPLSNLALGVVRRDIESAFAFRRRVLEEMLGS